MEKTITIIIPTFNSASTLSLCLESIFLQDYPKKNLEIIVADGGSSDATLNIVNQFRMKNYINVFTAKNPLKTGEAGKAAGLRHTKNEIIAFIDSDNILPAKDWLRRMIEPFDDPQIIASEPIEYTYRLTDGLITRYCALIGMNDPLCLFLGNYDRHSYLTGKWTQMPHKETDKNSYLEIELNKEQLPTIGANGFLIRKVSLDACLIGDYLFDIDIIPEIIKRTDVKLAKVKNGIVHIFSGNLSTFARKQRRRIRDYLYYKKLGIRKYPWNKVSRLKIFKFILYVILLIPLFAQSLRGYARKPDKAWFFHPVACWVTFWEYTWAELSGIFMVKELERNGWR